VEAITAVDQELRIPSCSHKLIDVTEPFRSRGGLSSMKPQVITLSLALSIVWGAQGQNLVPNPSFEQMSCELFMPEISCLQDWSDHLLLDEVNTPDLGYEGAVFFPPSTIAAWDGNQYLNLECSTGNPEYAQVALLEPLVAGTAYCVSFYASHSQESPEAAPSLGAYFTHSPLTNSPFEQGIQAHVQGPVNFDPTSWTLISGSFVAEGGEDILVLAGFENTGTMPFPYMYIDMVSVIPMPPLNLSDAELCEETIVLDAFAPGATYVWSTGATSSSIVVDAAGEFSVTRTIGECAQQTTVEVVACSTDPEDPEDPDNPDDPDNPTDPDDPENPDDQPIVAEDFVFYIPNAFTPDGDGINDVFGVTGPPSDRFLLQVFNRWGQLVFETTDISDRWMGNHQGGTHFVPDGAFAYFMKATSGVLSVEERGHVMMIR
jgi:gliding motility-associated-like protein